MIKRLFLVCIAVLLVCPTLADACVGKVLRIGAISSSDGVLLSEMLAIMINERTGSTVSVTMYNSTSDLYEAVKSQHVDILIENTATAMHVLNKQSLANMNKNYEIVKASYESEKGLIWLKPFGLINNKGGEGQSFAAPVLKVETLTNFPALPRVIEKLANILNDEVYAKMLKSVDAGEKPKSVARDLLKSKKLI